MSLVMAGRRAVPGETSAAPGAVRLQWGAEDFIRLVLALGVGGIVIVVSWYVCSGDPSFNRQIGPLDTAVGGIVFAALGNVMWLLRGRRALGERRRALFAAVPGVLGPIRASEAGAPRSGVAGNAPGVDIGSFAAGEGLVRYHRPACPLAEGRGWTQSTRQQHDDAGRLPCGVCRP